jgi:hypothetical protein
MNRHLRTLSAPASSGLERVAKFARANVRRARAAARIALSEDNRWQLPAGVSLLRDEQASETRLFLSRTTDRDGSGRASGPELSLNESDDWTRNARRSGRHRATTMVDAGARVSRRIPDLSRAMNLLSRVESGVTSVPASYLRKYATRMLASNTEGRIGAGAGHEMRRPPIVNAGILAKVRVARSTRGLMPPPGVSPREFARPSSDLRLSNDGNGRAAITINSSPTVVINSGPGGAPRHDVIDALRTHREELFDQLKRESTRRERAQF